MSRREMWWGGILLAILYLFAAITFWVAATQPDDDPYTPKCTEIHKQDSGARYCDE